MLKNLTPIVGIGLILSGAFASAQSLPNAVPMPIPEIQYLDAAGAPLAGSKLCTYAAGTSTPLATYTDSTAGSANANPIILDSAGRASVWVSAKLYKFVLRTGGDGTCSTGSIVWTQDNVADTTLYFTNYVKTVGTASLISYTNPATGAVSRTQLAKNNDVTSVKDFGAVGDGSTDDTAAIVKAIAYSSLSTCVYWPDGVYVTTAALTTTHAVCFTGSAWRLKYTGGSTIGAILKIVGGSQSPHDTFMEGTSIFGAILDGQGHATNGLQLQAVVSAQISFMRVTNVVDAGVLCNWCQQVTFDHLQVSEDFEHFTTTPTRGVVIDGISSANVFISVNIDHVSSHGIDIAYGFNTAFLGGSSEGVGGYGVHCLGGVSGSQCFNNTFIQLDVEVNTLGDYYFGTSTFNNSILQSNSFSHPGITFAGDSHGNTVVGGEIGGGSLGGVNTYGNRLINVSTTSIGVVPWTDSGQNYADPIRNQFDATVTDAVNNWSKNSIWDFSPAGRSFQIRTPSANEADTLTGNNTTQFMGTSCINGFTSCWFTYNDTGMNFMSETSPYTGAIADGSIVSHNWGFGRFNITPAYRWHFFDSTVGTMGIQAGSGQGGTPLVVYLDTTGAIMNTVTNKGIWNGTVQANQANQFTVSGCGANGLVGGATGGTFAVTTTGACSAVVTIGGASPVTAPHGWSCSTNNDTTANLLRALPTTATTVTVSGTTVSGDVLSFACTAY